MGREPNSTGPGVPPAPGGTKPDFSLPRGHRMLPACYRDTFARGRSFPGRYLVLWLREAPDADRRVGVVTSRNTLRMAVTRNRARRLLRETFRLQRAHLRPGVDVLLLARGRIEHAKRQEVDADFRAICCKAGIWSNEPC